ncbi:restriction endonuclease subunit S [Acinetobacter junii]|uniref:Restriction endonuclease subunit S n=1 Tax=Acinetobacter junii TaxID=40215 RepID=A0AAX1MM27_ACIJU|nr:restriction endonuclease subunit S [Acinetobacter junii]QUY37622.1 restriction endonuclease subunit S [Acinetobacter junii]
MSAPKLRFKDFDEDWTAKKLSQVANLTSSKRVHLSDYVSEGIPFFRGKEITELKSGIFPKDILYISKKQYEDFKEKFGAPQNNEILMTAVGTLANTYLINTDFEFYFKDGNLIWFKDINADPNFLMILLDARKNDVLASAIGSTQKALTIANLNKLIFNFPSNEEQTKIASFLSAVDEKISQLTQKQQLLSQYKQGMMQKLFSQQIRFKADDGSEFGEWEETNFSSQFNFHNTNSHSRALLAEYGEIMNIHYGDIHTKFSMLFDVTKENIPFLNVEVDTSKITNEQFLKVGDLVIADASEDYKDIGKAIEVISLNNQKVVAGLHTYIARPVKPFALGFCGYMMQTFEVREQVKKLATGISVLGISKTNLGKVELRIPCLEEQTKIANFLSAIDQKNEVVAQQIEQAKLWKKGLLQQMFV